VIWRVRGRGGRFGKNFQKVSCEKLLLQEMERLEKNKFRKCGG
jgi:hypothetical protein